VSAGERAYRLAGHRFAVRSDCPDFLRALHAVLGAFRGGPGGAPGTQHYEIEKADGFVIRKGRRFVARCPEMGDAVECVESMMHMDLVRLLDRRLLFHAGAVARGGALLVLPARAGSGKTTLVAGLLKRGCRYLTDEMLILSPRTLRAIPFPRPLNLKRGSLSLFPRLGPELEPVRPGELRNPRAHIHHLRVKPRFRQRVPLAARRRIFLFPAWRRDAPARLQTLSRVEAIRSLASVCYNHFLYGARFLALCERLTRGALCARLEYGRLQSALRLIDHRVLRLGRAS
jgi:hypothetical protein